MEDILFSDGNTSTLLMLSYLLDRVLLSLGDMFNFSKD